MINHIDIKGWEGHVNSRLDFSPGVNVILGPTDAGKSAVLRALMGVAFNRPLDKSVINDRAKEYCVWLGLSEGRDIIRTRNNSGNKNTYEMDSTVYKAFGHNPPEDVASVLNLDRDLNVQAQIDPIFLIQSSPGEIARHFNESAGLDEIDRSMSNLHSRERKLKSQVQQHETRTKELQEQLERYTGLEEIEGRLSELEQEQARIDELRRKRDEIKRQADRVKQAQEKAAQYREMAGLREPVQECLDLMGQIEQKKRERKGWQDLAAKARKTGKAVDKATKELQRLRTEWEQNAPDTCPLCDGEGRLK